MSQRYYLKFGIPVANPNAFNTANTAMIIKITFMIVKNGSPIGKKEIAQKASPNTTRNTINEIINLHLFNSNRCPCDIPLRCC